MIKGLKSLKSVKVNLSEFRSILSNLEGKVVLDVGKFIGETAISFLSNGFLNEVSYNNFGADFGREIGSNKIKIKVRNINYFLSFKPDIAKFNCEGCEKSILCANVDYIKAINEWFIQTHEEGLEKEIKHLMLKLGFTLIEEYRHQTKSCIWTLHFKWI